MDSEEERRQQQEAEEYFSIGHGDEYFKDEEPEDKLWVLVKDKIISKNITEGTHGTIWSHRFCNQTWKGRFDAINNIVSVVPPEDLSKSYSPNSSQKMYIPESLLNKIRTSFPGAKIKGFGGCTAKSFNFFKMSKKH